MTDNEIIKALECCKAGCFSDCPLNDASDCIGYLAQVSLDLIQRQRERIDRLKYNLDEVLKERADHTEAVKEFVEKLKKKQRRMRELYEWHDVVDIDDIDNLVKEMVGESDDG